MEFDWPSLVVSIAAALIAVAAWWESRKSRKAAEASATSAETSAAAATRSADEAERQTQIESDRRRDEQESRHDSISPTTDAKITIESLDGKAGKYALFGSITLARDYRVQAEGWIGNSSTPISGLPSLLRAHTTYRFYIEPWSKDQTTARTEKIQLRFWPPVAGVDEVDPWECLCGRPTGETLKGAGHWNYP
jgi:hypothetical protein